MSRPKPNILLEYVDKKTYKSEQVLQADAIWAVFYEGAPFNLKTQNILTSYPGPKYKKVSFSIYFFNLFTLPPVMVFFPVSITEIFQS